MSKEKRKQIILIALAFLFIGIGSFNFYNQYKSVEVASGISRNETNLGDVQLVNSEITNEKVEKNYVEGIVSNDELNKLEDKKEFNNNDNNNLKNNEKNNLNNDSKKEEIINTNTKEEKKEIENNYFVETRLERDKMYSEMLEVYEKMLSNNEISETQKAIASQEISNINNCKNGIMISENLIKNKGFEEVVIMINNGNVSVIVKSSLLTKEQIAQIQNITSRELNVGLENIYITKK